MQFIKLCDFCYIVKQTVNEGNRSESFLSKFLTWFIFILILFMKQYVKNSELEKGFGLTGAQPHHLPRHTGKKNH